MGGREQGDATPCSGPGCRRENPAISASERLRGYMISSLMPSSWLQMSDIYTLHSQTMTSCQWADKLATRLGKQGPGSAHISKLAGW